jgi:hypothetical protein
MRDFEHERPMQEHNGAQEHNDGDQLRRATAPNRQEQP